MLIKKYLNITKKEVELKKFNIWIGISLGNKYFTKENIKKYILWALENTKDNVVVLIADEIHAINYEIRNNYPKKRALNVALRKGVEIKQAISKIIKSLPKEKQNKINILLWKELKRDKNYIKSRKKIFEEFKLNKKFYNIIIKIVKENKNLKNLEGEDYNNLAKYVLNELPILISGIKYKRKNYNLIPYPGIGRIDYLSVDLQEGKSFPKLTKKLGIKVKNLILEMYVD